VSTREFLLVRHPETIANAEGRHVARGDSPYSPLGERQAQDLPAAVLDWHPEAIVASPQRRAFVPARAAAMRGDIPLRVDADLAEFDVGEVEGLTHAEARDSGLVLGGDWFDPDAVPYRGGERVGSFQARCVAAWERAFAEPAERVAVFSHRGVIVTMALHALELAPSALWHLRIDPACALRLELVGEHATLVGLGPLPDMVPGATMRSNP
jgi:probable phosphoglycerate mutase